MLLLYILILIFFFIVCVFFFYFFFFSSRRRHTRSKRDWSSDVCSSDLSTCISFGGFRADAAVSKEVLQAVSETAIQAAVEAAEQMQQRRQDLRKAIELELEQAHYEARLAARRYESVDPQQRLVAAELEARWNSVLQKVNELENKLHEF